MGELDDTGGQGPSALWQVGGIILAAVGILLSFLALAIAGGGHTSPFSGSQQDAIFALALLSAPLTIVAIGFCLIARRSTSLQLALGFAVLVPVEIALVAAVNWYQQQREEAVIIPASSADAVIKTTVVRPATPPPQPRPIGAAGDKK